MFLHRCCCWTTHQRIDVATGKRVRKYGILTGAGSGDVANALAAGASAFNDGQWTAAGSGALSQYNDAGKRLWTISGISGIKLPAEITVLSDGSVFHSTTGSPGFTNAYLYNPDGSLANSATSTFTRRSLFGSTVDLSDVVWGVGKSPSLPTLNDDLFRVNMSTLLAGTVVNQTGTGFKPSFDRSNGWISGGRVIYDTVNNTGVRPSEGWIGLGGGYAWKRSTSDTVLECYPQSSLTGSPIVTVTAFPDSSGNKAYTIGSTNSLGQIVVTSGGTNANPQEDIENVVVFGPDGSTLLRIDSGWRLNDSGTQWRRAFCNDVCWSPDETEIIICHQACDRFERPA